MSTGEPSPKSHKYEVDPDEVMIKCGLKKGNLEEYFIVKKSGHWRVRVRKLMGWE